MSHDRLFEVNKNFSYIQQIDIFVTVHTLHAFLGGAQSSLYGPSNYMDLLIQALMTDSSNGVAIQVLSDPISVPCRTKLNQLVFFCRVFLVELEHIEEAEQYGRQQ